MTNYTLDREKLKEILLAHESFMKNRYNKLIYQGMDISKLTDREKEKFTEEFVETLINCGWF